MEEKATVILDCGTSWCRAGFSTDTGTAPTVVLPNVVGSPKSGICSGKQTYFIGDTAMSKRNELSIRFPIEYGFITRWDLMELMWQALINDKLGVEAEEHSFLLVQTGNVPRSHFEKTSEVFFESFNVPSLCFMSSGGLSLLASDVCTGIAVEIGGGACFPVPVVKGYALKHFMQRTEFSGRDLTATLSRMMSQSTDSATSSVKDFETINSIKEKCCRCAENYELECQNFSSENEIVYTLPDCNTAIKIRAEQFKCPESLFKPHLAEKEFPGLHEIVFKCIEAIDHTVQSEVSSNIVLCGGSSFFPGLAPRLQRELERLATSRGYKHKINITLSPFLHAAFQGAKIVTGSKDFKDMSVSKEFYDEYGPCAVSKHFK